MNLGLHTNLHTLSRETSDWRSFGGPSKGSGSGGPLLRKPHPPRRISTTATCPLLQESITHIILHQAFRAGRAESSFVSIAHYMKREVNSCFSGWATNCPCHDGAVWRSLEADFASRRLPHISYVSRVAKGGGCGNRGDLFRFGFGKADDDGHTRTCWTTTLCLPLRTMSSTSTLYLCTIFNTRVYFFPPGAELVRGACTHQSYNDRYEPMITMTPAGLPQPEVAHKRIQILDGVFF